MTVEPYDFRKPGRLEAPIEQRLAAWLTSFAKRAADRYSFRSGDRYNFIGFRVAASAARTP